ncbi:hypothetical protein ASPWEDRAFT_643314 [Aspergillus wentii DTO 134E9]|uniref:Uncharacterized protein n=1 Tax=Aspergillus wentii DTO 134E9 TaxID=1073089 RepID=A0A1L9RAQ3_ASPWE|nr:uncharacterized protein ASPWEDRAFT_643314 [Aspergillus wentii DTO 134E9]KAI9934521.1 hypothetical protein MW887_000135 [Aspergillus wentii]OJJ31937.1 hypothetical protein ASPWEDRAFT_643314 [Aspergillus wentii DTO 134E9]
MTLAAVTMLPRDPSVGNSDAAQDLYGIGVRVGFYLQALGMILYNYSIKEDYGKGLKIASGSITLSLLASWYVFAAQGLFSPSEAIMVLLIVMSLSLPAKVTLLNPRNVVGETIGLITLVLVELGTCAALLWTFARLIHTLPRLQTPNIIFFFAPVSITGWFQYVALVVCTVDALFSLPYVYKVARVIEISWRLYRENHAEISKEDGEKIHEEKYRQIAERIDWENHRKGIAILRWLAWILVIIAVETTIYWNQLSPLNDFQSPGQLIPLVAGIVIFIDSVFEAGPNILAHVEEQFRKIPDRWALVRAGFDQTFQWLRLRIYGSVREWVKKQRIFTQRRTEEVAEGLQV